MPDNSSVLARIFARIRVSENGCWEWTGCKTRPGEDGYGLISYKGKSWLVHRLVYVLMKGPLPKGKQLHHTCNNRICFRLDHLEPVTPKEHTALGSLKNKTHCNHGHEYTPENTYLDSKGCRNCRECRRLGSQRREVARKSEVEERRAAGIKREYLRRAHCKHGHAFDEKNTLVVFAHGRQERQCRTCNRERMRERYRRSKST